MKSKPIASRGLRLDERQRAGFDLTPLEPFEPRRKPSAFNSVHSTIPAVDIDEMDESFLARKVHVSETSTPSLDQEYFPSDSPDIVIDELIREHEARVRSENFGRGRRRSSSRVDTAWRPARSWDR